MGRRTQLPSPRRQRIPERTRAITRRHRTTATARCSTLRERAPPSTLPPMTAPATLPQSQAGRRARWTRARVREAAVAAGFARPARCAPTAGASARTAAPRPALIPTWGVRTAITAEASNLRSATRRVAPRSPTGSLAHTDSSQGTCVWAHAAVDGAPTSMWIRPTAAAAVPPARAFAWGAPTSRSPAIGHASHYRAPPAVGGAAAPGRFARVAFACPRCARLLCTGVPLLTATQASAAKPRAESCARTYRRTSRTVVVATSLARADRPATQESARARNRRADGGESTPSAICRVERRPSAAREGSAS
jgi:hypothetical protein